MTRDEAERLILVSKDHGDNIVHVSIAEFLLSELSQMEEKVKELQQELDREITYKNALEQAEAHLQSYKDENEQLRQNHNNVVDEYNQAESRLKRLGKAVEKHEAFKRTHKKIVSLENEELYNKSKEMNE